MSMDRQAALKLITQTFDAPFDAGRFTYFARNLLNKFDESKAAAWRGAYIADSFKDHVKQYHRLGTYTDPADHQIDLLVIELDKESALDRARTMQRNFVARHLKSRDNKAAALVATYHPHRPDWRFSLVKMEYNVHYDEAAERLKITEDLTPARRYSFLVGEHEPNHTAQQQLVPLLEDTRHNPSLDRLEAAFNIESVTKEFFQRYKSLFLDLKEALDTLAKKQAPVKAEFKRVGIDTANFAKKLLGQIVFLYFLQKKGWLGVAEGDAWGQGPKDFLGRLFAGDPLPGGHTIRYNNFFNDVLEPLFYEALAIERPGDVYPRLNCKIPFLNGGLFEPVRGYDWRGVDMPLPNDHFRAIFETFDLYNFTVREDEPLEKEVAVDPEMLGKVFENLLEVQDRKSKGAFYTPREIVHYMCQESLINYLDTTLNPPKAESLLPPKPKQGKLFGDPEPEQLSLTLSSPPLATEGRTEGGPGYIPREDLDLFIRRGELALEHDAAKAQGTKSYSYHLPESIRANAAALDTALANIKICDPAIGSGAFPVGLMQEIVKARVVLTPYLSPPSNSPHRGEDSASPPKGGIEGGRTPYRFKRHAIQESIYGVDIDPAAVDIAKLRLWLSLVVDEEDYHHIQPLPNLGYKIVCGNALLGVQKDLFNRHLFEDLERLKPHYFAATDPAEKNRLRAEIDRLIDQLTAGQKVFDFEVYFSEVFHQKGGFDVVIGNPPWEKVKPQDPEFFKLYDADYRKKSKNEQKRLREKLLKNERIHSDYQKFLNSRYEIMKYASKYYRLQGSSDSNLYKLFLEKSLSISCSIICWVIPGSITIDNGSFELRKYLANNNLINELLGFSNKEGVFEWVDNNQKFLVISLQKSRNPEEMVKTLGWLSNANNLGEKSSILIDKDFYQKLDNANITFYLDTNPKSFEILRNFLDDHKLKPLRELRFHYWREYDATLDQSYFNDEKGKYKLFSGKAIDQFDCMAKSWLEKHGRSSRWKVMGFPKDEYSFRTEYYVNEIPERILNHHNKDNSQYRIVIQNVTGTVNNIRTVYACALHKKHLTNNSLHNLYIGTDDKELFFYLGVWNSFILDWQARIKVATNLNKFILESFIFPDYKKADTELREKISTISFWLSDVCSDFKEVRSSLRKVKFTSRSEAIIELNTLVAKLYGLNPSDLEFILSYFDLVDIAFRQEIINSYNFK